jgi:hypothetical protein
MKICCHKHIVVLLSAMAVAALDDGRMLLRSPGRRALVKLTSVEKVQDKAVGQGEGEAVGQIEDKAVGQGQRKAVGQGEGAWTPLQQVSDVP